MIILFQATFSYHHRELVIFVSNLPSILRDRGGFCTEEW